MSDVTEEFVLQFGTAINKAIDIFKNDDSEWSDRIRTTMRAAIEERKVFGPRDIRAIRAEAGLTGNTDSTVAILAMSELIEEGLVKIIYIASINGELVEYQDIMDIPDNADDFTSKYVLIEKQEN